jgi:hypothetical protein
MPADFALNQTQNDLKWAIVKEIESLGYEAQVFGGPAGGWGLAAGTGWSLAEVDRVMRRCSGAALIGLPKWRVQTEQREILLPTEYCHYEGGVAYTCGLPILAAVEQGLEPRVLFNWSGGLEIISIPQNAQIGWLQGDAFRRPFATWKKKLERRRDVFLGYASISRGLAVNLKRFLTELGVSSLDWHDDFAPGKSILDQLTEAASRCSGGIFLFTNDDKLDTPGESTIPRDNVVLEAGFFISAKGKDRVLIVRQKGSKMPADLGGDIYAALEDKSDIAPIEASIRAFAENL